MGRACRYEMLERNTDCTVMRCADCGEVVLSLGVVSLTLTEGQFNRLAASLQVARARARDRTADQDGDAVAEKRSGSLH